MPIQCTVPDGVQNEVDCMNKTLGGRRLLIAKQTKRKHTKGIVNQLAQMKANGWAHLRELTFNHNNSMT